MKENTQKALEKILSEVSATKLIWAVVGSTGLALQGVNIEPHDIDILTTERDIFKFEKILKIFVTEPVKYAETKFFKSYFSKLQINDVKVEVVANLQTKQKGANWSEKSRLDKVILINYKNLCVPVIPLVEEYKAYIRMGRVETAKKIEMMLINRKQSYKD